MMEWNETELWQKCLHSHSVGLMPLINMKDAHVVLLHSMYFIHGVYRQCERTPYGICVRFSCHLLEGGRWVGGNGELQAAHKMKLLESKSILISGLCFRTALRRYREETNCSFAQHTSMRVHSLRLYHWTSAINLHGLRIQTPIPYQKFLRNFSYWNHCLHDVVG